MVFILLFITITIIIILRATWSHVLGVAANERAAWQNPCSHAKLLDEARTGVEPASAAGTATGTQRTSDRPMNYTAAPSRSQMTRVSHGARLPAEG
ncbi:hypothetical protein P4O66_013244 [Electrophorus voltai]|uniref:Uncharacterized protein n=1 Tax=Electrophorus voltai TaxID=2609070 RepID=A0AAD9DS56_9TELE|nr:hypothetical protein P4O66_013244 [Electrophorus voltai]